MNLAGKKPLGLKEPKAGPDPEYLDRVRALPCCICEAWGIVQRSPTEAHHPIRQRHGTRKVPDRMAIPLCAGHHRGAPGFVGVHSSPAAWRQLFGLDTDWIAITQDKLLRDGE